MRPAKALHRAANASLDGHLRFVAKVHGQTVVLTLFDLAHCQDARIQCAFSAGKVVKPR